MLERVNACSGMHIFILAKMYKTSIYSSMSIYIYISVSLCIADSSQHPPHAQLRKEILDFVDTLSIEGEVPPVGRVKLLESIVHPGIICIIYTNTYTHSVT
jgi:hypothetical protein